MNYYPIELHAHTIHSDGDFTVAELTTDTKKFGYRAIFLTDHNTTSGYREVTDRTFVLPGIEWSTFYGHLTILGDETNFDWTKARQDKLEETLMDLKSQYNIVAGAVHPGIIAGDICAGCDFTFAIGDWNNLDYIEISNGDDAYMVYWTEESYRFWVDKLQRGYQIPAVSGRDLHRPNPYDSIFTLTMIGIDGIVDKEGVLEGIRKGRTYVTLGPELHLQNFQLGDTLKEGSHTLEYTVGKLYVSGIQRQISEIGEMEIRWIQNEKILLQHGITWDEKYRDELFLERGYCRFEITCDLRGEKDMKILISSPFYVQ